MDSDHALKAQTRFIFSPHSMYVDVARLLRQLGVRPRKRLGQHFVVDRRLIEVMASRVPEGSVVLEVGGGLGALTFELAKRAGRVYTIEVDPALCGYLSSTSPPNVSVICGDALSVQWPEADIVVSNVPYNISTPLLLRTLRYGKPAVLTLQREVAERLTAAPGTESYGRLTVIASCLADARIVARVPPTAFYPPPDVHSAVVLLQPHEPCTDRVEALERLTSALFSQRNRTLRSLVSRGVLSRVDPSLADKRVRQLTVSEILSLLDALVD